MALTVEKMQRIIIDEVLEKKPTVTGKRADEFRKKIQPDIEFVKENGGEIHIPPDLPG